ncbi:MAG TPA: alpha/beta fold hydrolase, partial [Thermoanaerobaculia bacterium]|nr:alpha/beta fold hydrolase [Thermoanaerobaculia bacterium]
TTKSKYERGNKNTKAERVIIFVHGVLGDAQQTWTNENGEYFPKLLGTDGTFDGVDIWVYDFASSLWSRSYTIDELADNLRLNLDNDNVIANHKEIIFVCHSMGGIIARAYLLKNREVVTPDRVPMMYFYSTPTAGSSVASLAKWVSRNPQLVDLRTMTTKDAGVLGVYESQWLSSEFRRTRTFCAYELQPSFAGIIIVGRASAMLLCNERQDPINRNHVTISKPADNIDDVSYIALREAYRTTFEQKSTPSPSRENASSKPRKLTGTVTNSATHTRVAFAKVTLDAGNTPKTVTTDSEGSFTFSFTHDDTSGRLRVEAEGFQPYERNIDLGAATKEEIPLDPFRTSQAGSTSSSKSRRLTGHVTNGETQARVSYAKVTIEIGGVPKLLTTDSEGFFSYSFMRDDSSGRIRVEAAGFQTYERFIELTGATSVEDIPLVPVKPQAPPEAEAVDEDRPWSVIIFGDHQERRADVISWMRDALGGNGHDTIVLFPKLADEQRLAPDLFRGSNSAFTRAQAGQRCSRLVIGKLSVRTVNTVDGLTIAEATLAVHVMSPSGELLRSFELTESGGGLNDDAAHRKAIEELKSVIQRDVPSSID